MEYGNTNNSFYSLRQQSMFRITVTHGLLLFVFSLFLVITVCVDIFTHHLIPSAEREKKKLQIGLGP